MMNFVLFCLWNAAIIKVIEQKNRFISVEKTPTFASGE